MHECLRAARYLKLCMQRDIKPSDILTRAAFENAITIVCILGGSTNAVLHLIACAKSANVPLDISDFQTISLRTPFLGNLQPSGKYMMEDLHAIGGIPAVLKYLMKNTNLIK